MSNFTKQFKTINNGNLQETSKSRKTEIGTLKKERQRTQHFKNT